MQTAALHHFCGLHAPSARSDSTISDGIFRIPNKRYTPEFKKQVVEAVIQDGLSYQEAARNYEVQGHGRIQSWERIYLEEGAEGLAVERRGRKSTGRPKKLPDKVEEDLLAEVQRLRAENAYLKNLQALVLEEERRQRKKRR